MFQYIKFFNMTLHNTLQIFYWFYNHSRGVFHMSICKMYLKNISKSTDLCCVTSNKIDTQKGHSIR